MNSISLHFTVVVVVVVFLFTQDRL